MVFLFLLLVTGPTGTSSKVSVAFAGYETDKSAAFKLLLDIVDSSAVPFSPNGANVSFRAIQEHVYSGGTAFYPDEAKHHAFVSSLDFDLLPIHRGQGTCLGG